MSDDNAVWVEMTSPLGPMILAASDDGLLGAWFPGQAHFAGVSSSWRQATDSPLLESAAGQLGEYFAGRRRSFALPLARVGTAFQHEVWKAIAGIPFGETSEYGVVAAILGKPGAARAVGAATGRNPFSIIVPCHRMLGRGGDLTGYAGGLDRKRALLVLEGVVT
jgi:methylated-DNA-[protein]-cysteine S-methyltransferase